MKTIGERIRTRREELKLSQEELAKKLGYKSRSSINKIEIGCQNLTQSKIKAIADALETTPAYIMGWEEIDNDIDLEKLKRDVKESSITMDRIIAEYGKTTWDALCMYLELDAEDQAEIRGEMKGLLKQEKYSIKQESKNA